MSKSNLKVLVKHLDNQLYELISHLICPICQELLTKPVTTPCGHSFCNGCIRRVLSSKDNNGCPLCKTLVRRYDLQVDNVKSTLIDICRELPSAFEKDVEDLNNQIKEPLEDVIKMSKLSQLYNQECVKDLRSNKKRNSLPNDKEKNTSKNKEADENDTATFVPVLKRTKNVHEYLSAKKKKMDDLVSISQTEVASNSSMCASLEIDTKLGKIEKIPPEEKVKEWFDAVGDNIYINSPNSSIDSLQISNVDHSTTSEKNNKGKTSMIRRDYNKVNLKNYFTSKENDNMKNTTNDPYEFVPSQQRKFFRKKRSRKNLVKNKKIPEFQALQNFTKESIKRNALLLNQKGEIEHDISVEDFKAQEELIDRKNEITASQKFDKLLTESKENEKSAVKAHTLYLASQASSPKFLDCSYNSKVDVNQDPVASKQKTPSSEEEYAIVEPKESKIELFTDYFVAECQEKGRKKNSKRKRSLENQKQNSKKRRLSSERQSDGENESDMKEYPKFKTKLLELLNDLVNDKIIYSDSVISKKVFSKEAESLLSENQNSKSLLPSESNNSKILMRDKEIEIITQNKDLIGFCTQEVSTLQEKKFKQMVANMEEELEELDAVEIALNEEENKVMEKSKKEVVNCKFKNQVLKPVSKTMVNLIEKNDAAIKNALNRFSSCASTTNLVPFNLLGKINKTKICFIDFLQLGRLTPPFKRSKSSVVKLVFPIGLSSFARKRPSQKKFAVGVQTSQVLKSSNHNQVSAEIQTSQKPVSSTLIQTSQRETYSVEIQTTQRFVSTDMQMQTSDPAFKEDEPFNKNSKSVEIQTSQVPFECAEVQTSQIQTTTTGNQTTVGSNEKDIQCSIRNRTQVEISTGCEEEVAKEFLSLHQSIEVDATHNVDNNNINDEDNKVSLRKSFSTHKKVIVKTNIESEKTSSPSSIELWSQSPTNEKPPSKEKIKEKSETGNLIMEGEIEKKFESSWIKNTQLVELKNKKNKEKTEKLKKLEEDLDKQSDDSDIQPPKRTKNCRRILSQDSSSPVKCCEPRQIIPLDIRRTNSSDQSVCEVISLASTKESQCSEEQMLRVLQNIDSDLKRFGKNNTNLEVVPEENITPAKGEESDSDFFVEQTPPKSAYSGFFEPETKNTKGPLKEKALKNEDLNSEGTDLIGDSLPKGLLDSESFLMLSAPEKIILTPKKSQKTTESQTEVEKFHSKSSQAKEKISSFPKENIFGKSQHNFQKPCPRPNENDQNQLNASVVGKFKRKDSEIRKQSELSQTKSNSQARKRLCVVASSVKNPEMIKKFVNKFKIEYLNKPTKAMTHLIVGLHENDDQEVLPLCTPKLLFAMANKKWVVSELWAEACLKKNEILPEDPFETLDPVGGCGCRSARLSTDNLLQNCEIYLLGNFQTIQKEEFANLIVDCGGTVVLKPEKFSFSHSKIRMIIADRDCLSMDEKQLHELHSKYSTVILSRDVIIMSIQSYKLANFTPYLLHLASEEDLLKMGYPSSLARNEEEEE